MPDAPDLSQDRLLAPLSRDRKGLPFIGGVSLVEKLGAGAFGPVYKGIQQSSGRAVAVRILEGKPGAEARAAAAIASPHLVKVLDVGSEKQTNFIVMEFVAGESAGALLKRQKKLSPADATRVAIAAAKGLAAAHAGGIVHRDVKPGGVLIPDGNLDAAKISDLGLAKPDGGPAQGTPGYLSPEQAEDARIVGPGADVFALGATLYALVMGEPPFKGAGRMEILRNTSHGNPTPLPQSASRALRWVVDKCLAKRPMDRFKDGAELLAALERAVAEPDAIGAPPPKAAPPVGPRTLAQPAAEPAAKRSLLPWIVAGLVVLAIAGVAAVVAMKSGLR